MRKLALVLCLAPLPALAQSNDRDFLTAFLEDNLSGAGRQVMITGFEGALTSRARITEMTIADDEGIWLTLRDVVLDWNRAALFSGNVSINQLTAAEIIILRAPNTAGDGATPEAGSFALPDLPVSVNIGRIAADRIDLAKAVLGQRVVGNFEASVALQSGEGRADLVLERTDDGPEGRITLEATYSNADKNLSLELTAKEGAGGLVATALNLPRAPSATFEISGEGPFSAFSADIALATDGVDRLVGTVTTEAQGDDATGFAADLGGDLAPLFLPAYAAFFGDRVALDVAGTAHADGRLDLSQFDMSSKALSLEGSLALGADGQPRAFDLTGKVAQTDGSPVLLPLTTDLPVRVQTADIALRYDQVSSDGWTGQATIIGLDRDDFRASSLVLTGSGRIAPGQSNATLRFDAEGLQPTDAALARALGPILSGDAEIILNADEPGASIPSLTLVGQDYSASVEGGRVKGLADGFAMSGKLLADLADLGRFEALARMPLAGSAKAEVAGTLEPLTGAFDVAVQAKGQNMRSGIQALDGLLRGEATIDAGLRRDEAGTRIERAAIRGNKVEADFSGLLSSDASDLAGTLRLSDLSVIGGSFRGAIVADGRLTGPFDDAKAVMTATGQGLRVGSPEIDRVLAGSSRLTADVNLRDGKVQINTATLVNPELSAEVTGVADGSSQSLTLKAQLRNLGLIIPEFPGALTLSGTVLNEVAGAQINLTGKGPGGIDATVTGRMAEGFGSGDLAIKGRAQAALINAFIEPRSIAGALGFDLRMNGPLAISSLTGQVTLQDGRLSDPGLKFAFEGMSARADLAGGRAQVTATLPLTTGGKAAVAGTIGLAAPYQAGLGIALQGVTLRDPDLYETRLGGELQLTGPILSGPLLAGRIDLIETELRVPSTGFGGAAGLPDLRHVAEPADVHATRQRAGLLDAITNAGRTTDSDLRLDLTISAPNRLFIRGRGLDAELGGEVRLLGTLANLQPSGAFELIRGRLEILGKRLELDEALLQLEGGLVPFLRILASTESDDITASVLIEGPADDPKVSFTSSPDLPEEEVLAQLLFGQGLLNLSALQALELANAVASLSGRGGEGLVSKLRQGFGLDNLDIKTTASGESEVAAGKYIGKNAYTEVTVGQDGTSRIELNLDLTKSITLRGRASADGTTGVGVFLEKDY